MGMRAARALWLACALLVVWVSGATEETEHVHSERHSREPPPPATSVLDIKNNIAKKVDQTIDEPDEVLPSGVDVRNPAAPPCLAPCAGPARGGAERGFFFRCMGEPRTGAVRCRQP